MAAPVPMAVQNLEAHIKSIRIVCGHRKSSQFHGQEGSFISREKLRNYLLRDENLENLLDALNIPLVNLEDIRNYYLRIFVILIQLNRAQKVLSFIGNPSLTDRYLPFRNKDLWPQECQEFFEEFFIQQWEYCVKKWKTGRLTGFKLENEALLPIVTEKILRDGSNSCTREIEVYHEYNCLDKLVSIPALSRSKTYDFLLKINGIE